MLLKIFLSNSKILAILTKIWYSNKIFLRVTEMIVVGHRLCRP